MDEKVATGIVGLDRMLDGGLPKSSIVLIVGCPGSGKTLLAAKFIYEGAKTYGEPGVYVCLTEPRNIFIHTMKQYGWDFEELIDRRLIEVLDLSIGTEMDSQSALNRIVEALNRINAKRFAVDSINALSVSFEDPSLKRRMIRLLYRILRKIECTSLLILEIPLGYSSFGTNVEEFIADGIIHLDQYFDSNGSLVRKIRVFKMRGVKHAIRSYEYTITEKGIEVLY